MIGMLKESAKLPVHVRVWMGFMGLTFAAHGFFLTSPLVVVSFVAFFATLLLIAPLTFAMTQNINALALSHFLVWPATLAYGLSEIYAGRGPEAGTLGLYLLLTGYGVFISSLALDFRILLKSLKLPAQA